MDSSIMQINNLVQGVTRAALWPHIMCDWAVLKAAQDDLVESPVSVGSLFGFISSMALYLKRAEKSTQISHHLPLVQTERSGAGARRNGPISEPAASSQQMHYSNVVRMLSKP